MVENRTRIRTITGIREMTADIDAAWRFFKGKAETKYQSYLELFDLVQLSKLSDEVKEYLKQPRRPPIR